MHDDNSLALAASSLVGANHQSADSVQDALPDLDAGMRVTGARESAVLNSDSASLICPRRQSQCDAARRNGRLRGGESGVLGPVAGVGSSVTTNSKVLRSASCWGASVVVVAGQASDITVPVSGMS